MNIRSAQLIRRFSFQEWGGTENVVWNSVQELNRHGIRADIIATEALNPTRQETVEEISIRRFPYFYPYWPMSAERKLLLDKKGGNPISFSLARAVSSGEYDLLHLHTAGRLGQQLAQIARRRDIPYVMSFHGGHFDIPAAEVNEMCAPLKHLFPYGGILDRALGWRRDLLAGAAALLCVGANELEPLRERYPGTRVEYLPNAVDPAKFTRPVTIDLRRYLKVPASTRILLCVSRIDPQKDQLLLLEATAALRERGEDVHTLLIGPVTSSGYLQTLQQTIAKRGIGDAVTIHPGLSPDDELLAAAYQQADLFVLCSRHEPFGIVVLEAWSASLPVVASTAGGLGRLVKDGTTGLQFAPGDLAGLLAACDTMRDAAVRRTLGANGNAEVSAHYTWAQIGARLSCLYGELTERRPLPQPRHPAIK